MRELVDIDPGKCMHKSADRVRRGREGKKRRRGGYMMGMRWHERWDMDMDMDTMKLC